MICSEGRKERFKIWLLSTVGMGVLPAAIRFLLTVSFSQKLCFSSFRAEFFFITIILLVDAIFTHVASTLAKGISVFALIFTVVLYSLSLLSDLEYLALQLNDVPIVISTVFFLIAGFSIDLSGVIRSE